MKFAQRTWASRMTIRALGIAAGTAVLGVAAVMVAGGPAGHASHPQTATLAAVSHPRSSPAAARRQAKSGAVPARPAGPARPAVPGREGRIISSGIREAGGELVFYGVRIQDRQLPGVTFGIMAGLRGAPGHLIPEVEANETVGSATSAGFHAVEAASSVGSPAVAVPEFGYYAGPAVKITAQEGSQQVQAHLARWSVNPSVVIFWFTPASAAPQDLTAYNSAGQQLPAGNSSPGNG